tara:strand:- start:64 stop:777 length:714 start_codon:yes stop_codon:yes gene_type:complete
MNKLYDSNISLEEKEHIYRLKDDPKFVFTSSTTFLGQFFEPFNQEKIATNLIANVPKYRNMSKDELLDTWKTSAGVGTIVHKELEDKIILDKDVIHPKALQGVQWMDDVLPPWLEVFAEVIIYSKELALAGMIDVLLHDPHTDEYVIVDWKTNKKISKESYKGKKGIHPITKSVDDCNFIKYSLQLSLYKYLLETYYGLHVKNLFIVHLQPTKYTQIKCPYMDDLLKQMLELQNDKP